MVKNSLLSSAVPQINIIVYVIIINGLLKIIVIINVKY